MSDPDKRPNTAVISARVRDCPDWRRTLLDAYKIEYELRCEEIEALEAERDRLAAECERLRTVLAKYAEPDSWRLSQQWGDEPWQLAADCLNSLDESPAVGEIGGVE